MNIEDIIKRDESVVTIKEKPFASTFIFIGASVCAYLSMSFPTDENTSFAMIFFSTVISLWGLKGLIWPKKHFQHKESKERIVRKEFYFDAVYMESVKKCLSGKTPLECLQRLRTLPQNGAMTLRVIIYTTHSGNYMKYQIQRYIPYEYVPV